MAEALFQKAEISVVQVAEYSQLQSALERVLAPAVVVQFLKKVQSAGLRVRDWQGVLDRGIVEALDAELKRSGKTAKVLYGLLTMSDQGLMREFYLSKLEQVEDSLRLKFSKVYRYY